MDLDHILREIGEFGSYQKRLIFFVFLPCMFPCAFHAYSQLFMAISPPHCCFLENGIDGTEYLQNRTCKNGYETMEFDSVESVSREIVICESDLRVTIALIVFGIAGFVGSYIFGYMQDRLGRKPSFFLYLFIECVFGVATAFVHNYWLWLAIRFGVGFTVPAILSTPYVLPLELVGPKYRTRCTIYSNIAYSLGLVSLAGIVFVFRNWRHLALAVTVPFVIFFLYMNFMPESPRWLLTSGRFDEAVKVLIKMSKINGTRLTESSLSKLRENFGGKKRDELLEKSRQYGVGDLFKNKSLRKKTLIIIFIWFTNTTVYVGLSYYAPVLSGDKYLNFFLAGAVELPTYVVLWPTMERYGRREILCTSMFIGGIACLLTTVTSRSDFVLVLYCIGKMGISSSYVVLPLFVSELYPTVVRGVGFSVGSVAGMLGPIFIPIVNYMGVGSSLPLMVMGTLLVLGGFFSLLLPETKNVHLPETIEENSP